ncbi:MAG: hypothetical protein ACRDHW_00815 [Ktedonobacteraceae bacterium]
MECLTVNFKPWHHARSQRPRNFEQFTEMVCADDQYGGRTKGIWEIIQSDRDGNVLERLWNLNVVTDAGAISLLKRGCNSAGATLPNLFNQIAMTNGSGSTTLTTALTNGQTGITSLAVAALPAAIPATTGGVATQLTIGFGSGQTQIVTVSAGAAAGATSISVVSFTSNAAYGIGTAVVPLPTVAEDPSALVGSLVSYSGALPTGAFTFTPTTGAGNRTDVATFQFTVAGGTSVGNYTDFWLVNTNPVGALGETLAHEINTPMRVDSVPNNITATVSLRI